MDHTPYECQSCDRRFGVLWCNDGQDMPVAFCPFCSSDELKDHTPPPIDDSNDEEKDDREPEHWYEEGGEG